MSNTTEGESQEVCALLRGSISDLLGRVDVRERAASLIEQQGGRIADLEQEVSEQARLNGMGAERELAQLARIAALEGALSVYVDPSDYAAPSAAGAPEPQAGQSARGVCGEIRGRRP